VEAALATAQHLLDGATVDLLQVRDRERDAEVQLALARDVLTQRIRAIYEAGPARAVDMFLSAQSTSDLLSVNEFASHAVQADMDAVNDVRQGETKLSRMRAAVQRRRDALVHRQDTVSALTDAMQAQVSRAQTAAHQLGVKVGALEATKRRLAAAHEREAVTRGLVLQNDPSATQQALLALLGPNGGHGCTIPSGLRATGETLSGDASWYGQDFAGQATASGQTFDPSLFTAAHRTLPLGSFLRVHYDGRCAIVLVNDRGPYGNYNRIIDLAQAPAQYLGLGVGYVTADVLVPR
jgi:hypothetical protein